MKSKLFYGFCILLIASCIFVAGLSMGRALELRANRLVEADLTEEIASRYLLYVDNPRTASEQFIFECVVYGDCNPDVFYNIHGDSVRLKPR